MRRTMRNSKRTRRSRGSRGTKTAASLTSRGTVTRFGSELRYKRHKSEDWRW